MEQQYFVDNFERAIREGWLQAYHQPLIRAANGRVSDEEAFARWIEPGKEPFSASEFIPALEQAALTAKLDLFIVDRILEKMQTQKKKGLYVVPESINLSGLDFRTCNMVEEIRNRIDAAGIEREKLSIELSERVVQSDIDFIKTQVERFQQLGIKVWMDDYGSGYSSMLILLKIKFNLLKIDKIFVDNIEISDEGRIIITELVKTALALGMDTVAEGVETREQVRFLKEIGCTKLQGYYYCNPIPQETIFERNKRGIQIGFENPDETGYYEQLGRVNMYDLAITRNDEIAFDRYFDTLPMVVFEIGCDRAKFIRCNRSYRDFVQKNFQKQKNRYVIDFSTVSQEAGYYSFLSARQVAADGKRIIVEDRTGTGKSLQLFMRRVAVNPLTNAAAVMIVVLYVSDSVSESSLTYNYIARALSDDYVDMFFVNMKSGKFIEYSSNGGWMGISEERHGDDFFSDVYINARELVYKEDQPIFNQIFNKETIQKNLDMSGSYSITYRRMIDGEPVYVNMKAVKLQNDKDHIIIGVNNVDAQMKQRAALEQVKEERLIYSRIGALSGDIVYIFTVDPETGRFTKYNPSNMISDIGIESAGEDYFTTVQQAAARGIYADDLNSFLSSFTRENILSAIEENGMFVHDHRLNFGGRPVYVRMKAVLLDEEGKKNLIVGIINRDAQVRKDMEYKKNLTAAQIRADFDDLTGVRNKNAYKEIVSDMDKSIKKDSQCDFAVVVFDLNGLKHVNDTMGHRAGDRFIKRGCDAICRTFKHSPVFRVGGDEFVVIAQGDDYEEIDALMEKIESFNVKNGKTGDVVIAAGMSRFKKDKNVSEVFERADERMYINKKKLKGESA